jgi:hypothetical protein
MWPCVVVVVVVVVVAVVVVVDVVVVHKDQPRQLLPFTETN